MLKFNVYVHEPLTDTSWQRVATAASPDVCADLMRSWGSRSWRVKVVSVEADNEEWSNV